MRQGAPGTIQGAPSQPPAEKSRDAADSQPGDTVGAEIHEVRWVREITGSPPRTDARSGPAQSVGSTTSTVRTIGSSTCLSTSTVSSPMGKVVPWAGSISTVSSR